MYESPRASSSNSSHCSLIRSVSRSARMARAFRKVSEARARSFMALIRQAVSLPSKSEITTAGRDKARDQHYFRYSILPVRETEAFGWHFRRRVPKWRLGGGFRLSALVLQTSIDHPSAP